MVHLYNVTLYKIAFKGKLITSDNHRLLDVLDEGLKMKKWEYYLIVADIRGKIKLKDGKVETQEYFNSLGQSGWELVSVVKILADSILSNDYLFTFKRPIDD